MMTPSLDTAYDACEEITRNEARNFAYGIRLLPVPKRQAMSALYAFARRVDDIGDGPGASHDKLVALATVRDQIASLSAGSHDSDDLVLVALADAAEHYAIPLDALYELVTGCEMDCREQAYESF